MRTFNNVQLVVQNDKVWVNDGTDGHCILRLNGLKLPVFDAEGGEDSWDMLDVYVKDSVASAHKAPLFRRGPSKAR